MAFMREAKDCSLHCLRECVRREFVMPVFGVKVFLDLADKRIAVSRDRHIGEVAVQDPGVRIDWHLAKIESHKLSERNGLRVFDLKVLPDPCRRLLSTSASACA
jgi:hypothetical protein